jgi:hypothetical protein
LSVQTTSRAQAAGSLGVVLAGGGAVTPVKNPAAIKMYQKGRFLRLSAEIL